jgi:aminoglycoside phosphotransferase (APT) family kinase protein
MQPVDPPSLEAPRGAAMHLHWHHERWVRQAAPTPALEALRAWFDLERVARVLAPMCPPGQPLQRVTIENVCYLPPQRLQVVYLLHTAGGRCLHASIDARCDPPDAVQAGASAARVGLDAGSAALAWLLPDDPADLPLARVTAPEFTERHLGVAVQRGSAALLSYLPGQRLAQRWSLASVPSAPPAAVVLKQQPGATATHARMQALWDDPRRGFAMPQPLACEHGHDARWERFVAGEHLAAAASRIGWDQAMARAVAALASLHGQAATVARSSAGIPLQTRAALLERLGGKLLRRVQAALPQRADAVAARVDALQRWLPPATPTDALLHGDLHPGNLLLAADGAVVLLGLDSLACGEVACDLGQLATRLVLQSLLGQLDANRAWSLTVALPRAYRQALRRAPDNAHADAVLALPPQAFHESFAWHVAALLLSCQLAACIRHAAPGLDGLCNELVRLSGGVAADRGVATLA